MQNEVVKVNNQEMTVKEYNGQRVVTFKDVDLVHARPEGTARKRFNDNKGRFIEGEDYFKVKCSEVRPFFGQTLPNGFNPEADIVLLTESGYLMLVKSFTDDLAWKVQRQLVKSYFTRHQIVSQELSPQLQLLINLELQQKEQAAKLNQLDSKIDSIKDVVALNPNDWRKDTAKLISRIALHIGGYEHIKQIREESYKLLEQRMGVSLSTRLTNKRRRMADEGICKSKRDKLNQVDVIADDKKLIEGYVAVIKDMAIKYGLADVEVA